MSVESSSVQLGFSRSEPFQLINESWDALLVGGLSIFFFAVMFLTVDTSTATASIAMTAHWLSFVINKPHFMLSYWFFYKDYKAENKKDPRWLMAFFVVPAVLIGLISYGLIQKQTWPFQAMVHAMYFLVGWHYIKQTFGIMMFRGGYKKYFFTSFERDLLLFNLGSLWMLNWLNWNRYGQKYEFFQIEYRSLIFPPWVLYVFWAAFTLSALMIVGLVLRKYVEKGKWPPLSVAASLVALYIWYIPSFYHPVYFLFIPLFHSLQYLVFAVSLKRNQIENKIGELKNKEWRAKFLKNSLFFIFAMVLLGAATFEWIPKFIDKNLGYEAQIFGTSLIVGVFTLVINIHHYFIDSVLWRKNSPLMRANHKKKHSLSSLPAQVKTSA